MHLNRVNNASSNCSYTFRENVTAMKERMSIQIIVLNTQLVEMKPFRTRIQLSYKTFALEVAFAPKMPFSMALK